MQIFRSINFIILINVLFSIIYCLIEPIRNPFNIALLLITFALHLVYSIVVIIKIKNSNPTPALPTREGVGFISKKHLMILFLFTRIAVLPMQPWLSDDVFTYLWQGKLTAKGINVYTELPESFKWKEYQDNVFDKMGNRNIPAIYPPFTVIINGTVHKIAEIFSDDWRFEFYLWKFLLLISEFLAFLIFIKMVDCKDYIYLLIYCILPLTTIEIAGQGHNDGLLFVFLALLIYYLKDERKYLKCHVERSETSSKKISLEKNSLKFQWINCFTRFFTSLPMTQKFIKSKAIIKANVILSLRRIQLLNSSYLKVPVQRTFLFFSLDSSQAQNDNFLHIKMCHLSYYLKVFVQHLRKTKFWLPLTQKFIKSKVIIKANVILSLRRIQLLNSSYLKVPVQRTFLFFYWMLRKLSMTIFRIKAWVISQISILFYLHFKMKKFFLKGKYFQQKIEDNLNSNNNTLVLKVWLRLKSSLLIGIQIAMLTLIKIIPFAFIAVIMKMKIKPINKAVIFLSAMIIISGFTIPFIFDYRAIEVFRNGQHYYNIVASFNSLPLLISRFILELFKINNWWLVAPYIVQFFRILAMAAAFIIIKPNDTKSTINGLILFYLISILISTKVHTWYFAPVIFLSLYNKNIALAFALQIFLFSYHYYLFNNQTLLPYLDILVWLFVIITYFLIRKGKITFSTNI